MIKILAQTALAFALLAGCGKTDIAPASVATVPVEIPETVAPVEAGVSSGQKLTFVTGSPDLGFLTSGWSGPEDHGTWSQAPEAIITLNLSSSLREKELVIRFVATAFVVAKVPAQTVKISAGGRELGEWKFSLGAEDEATREFIVPAELNPAPGPFVISFALPNSASPSALGIGQDIRQLGIHILSADLQINDPPTSAPTTSAPTSTP